jgi:hypothetical protein
LEITVHGIVTDPEDKPECPDTFEKCSILVKAKEGESFNHRNMLNISRIEI